MKEMPLRDFKTSSRSTFASIMSLPCGADSVVVLVTSRTLLGPLYWVGVNCTGNSQWQIQPSGDSRSTQLKSYQVKSCRIKSNQVTSGSVTHNLAKNCHL